MRLLVKGNKAVIKGLNTFEKRVEGKVKDSFEEWAIETENMAKTNVPVDTGELKNSINARVENEGWTWTVGTPVKYAPYVEFGTGTKVKIPQGLERYAEQFMSPNRDHNVNLPARSYLFNSARENFRKMIEKLKKDFGK